MASRPFNPLALAIMALLHEHPMHPYEIACTMRDRHLEESIKLNFGSLYHTVESLHQNGLVAPMEAGREGRRPERTVYRLTEAGENDFLARLRDLISHPEREYSRFEAALCFLPSLRSDEVQQLFRERICELQSTTATFDSVCATLQAGGLQRLSLIEIEHAQAIRRAELEWLSQVIEDIEQGRLEWPSRQPELQPVSGHVTTEEKL